MESKIVTEAEVERRTSAHSSVAYDLKGDGWKASYIPDSGNLCIHLDPIDKNNYRFGYNMITMPLADSIRLAQVIPEIVRNVLPLLMLNVNDKPTYATKTEPVELKRLNGTGLLTAQVLSAITHKKPNENER